MIYYASYGHRYNDPMGMVVGREYSEVEEALKLYIDEEINTLKDHCDIIHNEEEPEEECSFCSPDIVTYGIWPMLSSDINDIGRQRILDGFREIRGTFQKTFHLGEY